MNSKGDPNAAPTAVVGIVFTLLFIVIVVLLQGYYGRVRTRELQRKVISQTAVDVAQARATQLQKISEYRMLDSSQGIIAIPIERAMELVAAERGSGASSPPGSSAP